MRSSGEPWRELGMNGAKISEFDAAVLQMHNDSRESRGLTALGVKSGESAIGTFRSISFRGEVQTQREENEKL